MTRSNPETRLHIVIGDYLRTVLPRVSAATLFHCPNGENRAQKTGELLKRMGVLPGVADWLFVHDGILHCIEVKLRTDPIYGTVKTYQNQSQKDFQAAIEAAGARYEVCRHTDEVKAILALWGVPTRERAQA